MSPELAAVICTSIVAIIVAVIKFAPSKKKNNPGTTSVCPAHSGIVQQAKTQDENIVALFKIVNETKEVVIKIATKLKIE